MTEEIISPQRRAFLTSWTVICGGVLQVSHDGGLMEALRLLTALQRWRGCINLSALKPLELVSVDKMQAGIDEEESVNFCTRVCNFPPYLDEEDYKLFTRYSREVELRASGLGCIYLKALLRLVNNVCL